MALSEEVKEQTLELRLLWFARIHCATAAASATW